MPLNSPIHESAGCLFVVGLPIGNPEDITLRALKILSEVDVVAAEDTRVTGRFLANYDITPTLLSYHEHNEPQRAAELIARLSDGDRVALVSDAGTPSISDPGYRLIHAAAKKEIRIVPVPGASAAVTALSISGLPTDAFMFIGFLPKKKGKRDEVLQQWARFPHSLIIYESPRRMAALIDRLQTLWGDRQAVLAREMTKPHEEFLRGRLSRIGQHLAERNTLRGECTLLVAGCTAAPAASRQAIDEEMRRHIRAGRTGSQAAKEIARKCGISRSRAYEMLLQMKSQMLSVEPQSTQNEDKNPLERNHHE